MNEQPKIVLKEIAASDNPIRNRSQWAGFLLASAGLMLCFGKPLYELARFCFGSELYSHIFLIPFVSVYLLWENRKKSSDQSLPPRHLTLFFIGAGLIAVAGYWLATRYSVTLTIEDYLAWMMFSFLLLFAGICAWFWERTTLRNAVFPICFLVFMIPVPTVLMDGVVTFLQHTSAITAVAMFKMAGTPTLYGDLHFRLPGMELEVAPECSGIHSTLVLLITSLVAGYLFLRSPWKRTWLAVAVIPLAILRNGFRIFTIGELCVHVGPHMIDSPIHHRGGPIFFALSLVPFFLLLYFFRRAESRKTGGANLKQKFDMIKSRYISLLLLLALFIAGATGCSKKARAARYLSTGDTQYQAQQYDKAEIEYLNVLRVSPVNPAAIRQLGFIYYDQGKLPQAYAYLQKAAELDTNNVELRLKLGLTYLSVRKLKEAGETAAWVLQRDPGDEEALSLLATVPVTQKEIQGTVQFINQLQQQDQDKPGYHLALGTLYFRQRETARAENEFSKALALNPKSSAAYVAIATIYWSRNDLKRAEEAFKTAADLSPIRSARRLKYVDFKIQTGDVTAAKKTLEEITQKAPDYLPAWTYLMKITFSERKFEECDVIVKKILSQDPRNLEASLTSGSIKLAQGDADKAIAEFERLKAIYNTVPQLHFQLALAYLANKDSQKALASVNQALVLYPDYPEAILVAAQLNIRNGNAATAIASLTQLTKQQPQLAQAQLLLANAYLALSSPNYDEALAVYHHMGVLFPKSAEVPLLAGMVFLQQKNLNSARASFEKSLEIAPNYLSAIEQLVDLDILAQQYAPALERVKNYAAKYPKAGEPQLLYAKIHLAQQDQTQAEADLLKAIELNPDARTPYLLLAQLYVTTGKKQQALERLNSLVAKTNDVSALMQIGMIENESTNYPAARDAYEKLLTVNPKFSFALNNLAYLYSEKFNQLDKAYEMAGQARQLLPYDPFTADTFGWILFKRGDYSRALGLLQESVAKLLTEPEVQYHLGMTHYMMGEEEVARIALQRAVSATADFTGKDDARHWLALLAIDPKTADAEVLAALEKEVRGNGNDPVALNRIGAIYERMGNNDKAVQTYETALKQNPKNSRLMFKLAQLYATRPADQSKALELAKNAHNLSPDDPNVSHMLSRLVFQAGDYKWALSLIQDASLKLPDQPEFLYDLAWSYYSLGRIPEAESTMDTAVQKGLSANKLDEAKRFLTFISAAKNSATAQAATDLAQKVLITNSDYVPALMVVALTQEKQGAYPSAQQSYDKILVHFPQFAPAARQLAGLYAGSLADDKKGYELAIQARETLANDPDLAKILGIFVYRRGDDLRAIQLFKQSAASNEADPEIWYHLGIAQYRVKDLVGSKISLQKALNLNLSGKFATEAKKILAGLK